MQLFLDKKEKDMGCVWHTDPRLKRGRNTDWADLHKFFISLMRNFLKRKKQIDKDFFCL